MNTVDVIEGRQPSPSSYLQKSHPLPDRRDSTEKYAPKAVLATPSPTNHQHDTTTSGKISILATSSPEIKTLQMPSFEFFDGRSSGSPTSLKRHIALQEFNTNNHAMTMMNAHTPEASKRHVPRVSLSPPRDFNSSQFSVGTTPCGETSSLAVPSYFHDVRSPLDDITKSLCRVRLSTPSTARSTPNSNRSTPTPPARGPSNRKPTLHRRVSFDMLPTPSEYAGTAECTPPKASRSPTVTQFSLPSGYIPVRATRSVSMSNIPSSGYSPNKGRRHRRNTTVIMLSANLK